MICLSFNCKGLANPIKRLALKELLFTTSIDALFLQETLVDGISINNILNSLLPNWTFVTLDAQGLSGGCALGMNNRTTQMLSCYGWEGVIGFEVSNGDFEHSFTLINVYGPCVNRENV